MTAKWAPSPAWVLPCSAPGAAGWRPPARRRTRPRRGSGWHLGPVSTSGKTWKNMEKPWKTHKIIWKIWEQLGRYGKNRRYLENIWNKMDTFGGRNHKYRDPFGTYLILFTHRSPLFTRYVQSGPPGPELGTRVHEFFEVSSFTSHFDTFWSHQLSKIWGKGGASLPV